MVVGPTFWIDRGTTHFDPWRLYVLSSWWVLIMKSIIGFIYAYIRIYYV